MAEVTTTSSSDFNYFLQVELKVHCYANCTLSPSYLSISWLRSSLGSHPIAQTMSGGALPLRCGDETWACKWEVFWVAFLLRHLVSKASSSPSLLPAPLHGCNRLSGLPPSCSFRTVSPQFHKKTMLAQRLGCHTSLPTVHSTTFCWILNQFFSLQETPALPLHSCPPHTHPICPPELPNQGIRRQEIPQHPCQGWAQPLQGTWLRKKTVCPLENTAITSLVTSGALCVDIYSSKTFKQGAGMVAPAGRFTLETICKVLPLLESHLAITASSDTPTHRSPQNSNRKGSVITVFTEANQYAKAGDLLQQRQPVCRAKKCI